MINLQSNCFPEPVDTGSGQIAPSMRCQRKLTSTSWVLPLSCGMDFHIGISKLSQTVMTEPFPSRKPLVAQSSPLLSKSNIWCDCENNILKAKIHPRRLDVIEGNRVKPLSSSFSSYNASSTAADQLEFTQDQNKNGLVYLTHYDLPTHPTIKMNSIPSINLDQHHPGGVFPLVDNTSSVNSDVLALNPTNFNGNVVSFPQQPTMGFFQDRYTGDSSLEVPPRFSNAQATTLVGSNDRTLLSRFDPAGRSLQLADFINESVSYQNSLSLLGSNQNNQNLKEWEFLEFLSDSNQSTYSIEHPAVDGAAIGEPVLSENLPEPFNLLSFTASNVPDYASQPFGEHNRLNQTCQKDSDSIGFDSFSPLTQSSKPSEFYATASVNSRIENALEEGDEYQHPFASNLYETRHNVCPKYEYDSTENPVYEKTPPPPHLSSSSSTSSSQFSSPSLSASPSLNKNFFAYSPFHTSTELNNLDEDYSVLDPFTNSFLQVEDQYQYQPGSLEELFNASQYPNLPDTTTNCNIPKMENVHHFQYRPEHQHLLGQSQRQQSWTHSLQQQIENVTFSNPTQYSSGISTCRQRSIFICPKCGKGHTRQSNLLAHLRDTHSDVKTVFCDVPGCAKAYKRISECRRHKKDFHGIPLPSEVNGKLRKTRSTTSSIRPSKCKHVLPRRQ